VVSAGSTAAQMASATLLLKRIKGIDRPAISTLYPTLKGGKVILDIGANTNIEPKQLVQFALMGKTYAEVILKIPHPRVALLSNGTEEGKGNEIVVEAHQLLKDAKKRHLGVAGEFVSIIEGPVGVDGEVLEILDIKVANLPKEWQEKVRKGELDFSSEQELLEALDSIDEYE
jgi:fatty acid/phospholipid biosynthesis enzyme